MIKGEISVSDSPIIEDEPVFSGMMEWDGEIVKTRIVLTKSVDALLGTALLRGMDVLLNYSTSEVVLKKEE